MERPPVVCFVASSGTGKTTLLEKVITGLKDRGYRVGAVKHDTHGFEMDHEGKDSWRLKKAGADVTAVTSREETAVIRRHPEGPEGEIGDLVRRDFADVDIVLVEGGKGSSLPKIEVHRRALGHDLISGSGPAPGGFVAVVTDSPVEGGLPALPLDDPGAVCDFIVARFLAREDGDR